MTSANVSNYWSRKRDSEGKIPCYPANRWLLKNQCTGPSTRDDSDTGGLG